MPPSQKRNMTLTWECPIEMQESEAYALALCIRIRGTVKKDGQTYLPIGDDAVEVRLTAELAEAVLPHYAYLRHKIRCSPFVYKGSHVAPMILGLVKDDVETEVVQREWSRTHADIVEQTRKDLAELVAAGFRCRG